MATIISSTADAATYGVDSINATSERLYQVQSRAARPLYNNNSSDTSYVDRGPIASIKLITTNNLLGGISLEDRARLGGVDPSYLNLLLGKGTATVDNTGYGDKYDRFLLTDCAVSYSEKTQIMTTFGDNEVIYFFGKNPVIMNLSGMLIDSLHNDWFTSFVDIYQTFLRGTKLSQNFEMIELVLPNMKVIGSIISLNHQQNAGRDTDIPFSMQFYAKSITMLPAILMSSTAAQNNAVSTIFTNPTRAGASGGMNTTDGFSEPSWVNKPNVLSTGYSIFKNNVSSPVVSVIASIARVVQSITNNLTNIVSSLTTPVNSVLRDIMSISVQATAVANLVQNSAAGIGHLLATPGINLKNTLASLKNTAGVISRLPESVSDAFKRNYHGGNIRRGAAILSSGINNNVSKTAVLSSGRPYTTQNSFRI